MSVSALGGSIERNAILQKLFDRYSNLEIAKPTPSRKCFACNTMEMRGTSPEEATRSLGDELRSKAGRPSTPTPSVEEFEQGFLETVAEGDGAVDGGDAGGRSAKDKEDESKILSQNRISDYFNAMAASQENEVKEEKEVNNNAGKDPSTKINHNSDVSNSKEKDGINNGGPSKDVGKPPGGMANGVPNGVANGVAKPVPENSDALKRTPAVPLNRKIVPERPPPAAMLTRKDVAALMARSGGPKADPRFRKFTHPRVAAQNAKAKEANKKREEEKKALDIYPYNEQKIDILNRRTLDRSRVKLAREIAALDPLPESVTAELQQESFTSSEDPPSEIAETPSAKSSLILKERKVRSETKKEMGLRRRRAPRLADRRRFRFSLAPTAYQTRRPLPKPRLLPKVGQTPEAKKLEKLLSSASEESRESKSASSSDSSGSRKSDVPPKHVSFGPTRVLNVDEQFAMMVRSSIDQGDQMGSHQRAGLRRQNRIDVPSPRRNARLSPMATRRSRSVTPDRSFGSSERKPLPKFTAKPVLTLPKIGDPARSTTEEKSLQNGGSASDADGSSQSEEASEEAPVKTPEVKTPEVKKPIKSILKVTNHLPEVPLSANCSPEFRAIMDSLHGIKPSPFLVLK